jgi:hypothetical protein
VESARAALTKAIERAAKHGFHQITHEAEGELEQLERSTRIVRRAAEYQPTPRVEEIVTAIHDMREIAGLAR